MLAQLNKFHSGLLNYRNWYTSISIYPFDTSSRLYKKNKKGLLMVTSNSTLVIMNIKLMVKHALSSQWWNEQEQINAEDKKKHSLQYYSCYGKFKEFCLFLYFVIRITTIAEHVKMGEVYFNKTRIFLMNSGQIPTESLA